MADTKKKPFPIKHIALWTGWYFVASYFVFLFLFRFDILHISDWMKIQSIVLHGFAGLSFGMALLAWVPIWLAGCKTIIKSGKPLTLIEKKEAPKKDDDAPAPAPEDKKIIFPKNLPEEMRVPYSRMIRGQLSRGAIDCKIIPTKPDSELSAQCDQNEAEAPMALPESFDFDAKEESAAPMFKELSWGSLDSDTETEFDTSADEKIEIKIETRGDKKFAVATHDDSDFWIADGENWFATGKQKPSPVTSVIDVAKKENATPALLLKSENIMDIDTLKEKWTTDGVKIIKDLSEL